MKYPTAIVLASGMALFVISAAADDSLPLPAPAFHLSFTNGLTPEIGPDNPGKWTGVKPPQFHERGVDGPALMVGDVDGNQKCPAVSFEALPGTKDSGTMLFWVRGLKNWDLYRTAYSQPPGPSQNIATGGGEGLGGIFKLLFAYVTCGRPYPYADAAVRTILSLQSEAGDFAGANMCMNWDALVALRYLTHDLRDTPRRAAILQAAERLAARLCRDFRKPDGGFSFFHNICVPNHNSVRVSAFYPESDVMGTAMCLDCLSLVDAWRTGRPGRSFLDVYYKLNN